MPFFIQRNLMERYLQTTAAHHTELFETDGKVLCANLRYWLGREYGGSVVVWKQYESLRGPPQLPNQLSALRSWYVTCRDCKLMSTTQVMLACLHVCYCSACRFLSWCSFLWNVMWLFAHPRELCILSNVIESNSLLLSKESGLLFVFCFFADRLALLHHLLGPNDTTRPSSFFLFDFRHKLRTPFPFVLAPRWNRFRLDRSLSRFTGYELAPLPWT